MVLKVNVLLLLLPGSILHIQNTDKVSRPTPQQAVEDLQDDAGDHPQLREGRR